MEDELSGQRDKKKQVKAKAKIEAAARAEPKPRAPDGRLEKYSDEEEEVYNAERMGISKDKLDKLQELIDGMGDEPTDEQLDAFGTMLTSMTTPRKHKDNRPKNAAGADDIYSKLAKDELGLVHPIASGMSRNVEPIFSYDDQVRINEWLDGQIGRYPKGYR